MLGAWARHNTHTLDSVHNLITKKLLSARKSNEKPIPDIAKMLANVTEDRQHSANAVFLLWYIMDILWICHAKQLTKLVSPDNTDI